MASDERRGAPVSWYTWYVVGVMMLANVSGFIDQQILAYLVGPIRRDFALTDSQMSYLGGPAFAILYALLGLPIAWLADRASRRAIMGWGTAAWSVFSAGCGIVKTYSSLFFMRVGVGIGEATLNAPSVSLIADYVPRERLGRAMSVFSLGIFLGSGLGYIIGGWVVGLAEAQGTRVLPIVGAVHPWQIVFLAVGLPGLIVAALFATVREPARKNSVGAQSSVGALMRYVSANRRTFLTQSFGFGMSALVNFAIAFWLPTFFIRTYKWTEAQAGQVQGILTATIGVAGVLAGGWVSDWFVRRGKIDGPLRVGMIGALGMLVSATAYPLMPTAALAVVWLAVVNFFAALPWGAASAAAAEVMPPSLRAQGAALYFFVLSLLGRGLGPSCVAWITDYGFHNDASVRYSLAIVNAGGMMLALALFAAGRGAYQQTVTARTTSVVGS